MLSQLHQHQSHQLFIIFYGKKSSETSRTIILNKSLRFMSNSILEDFFNVKPKMADPVEPSVEFRPTSKKG